MGRVRVGVGHQHGRQLGGRRLECPAHLEQVEHACVMVEIDDEAHRFHQDFRLQARHLGAVALTHVKDADQRQRADRFAQGVPADAEILGQVRLTR